MEIFSIKMRIRAPEPQKLIDIIERLTAELSGYLNQSVRLSSSSFVGLATGYIVKLRVESREEIERIVHLGIPSFSLIIEIETADPVKVEPILRAIVRVTRELGGVIELI